MSTPSPSPSNTTTATIAELSAVTPTMNSQLEIEESGQSGSMTLTELQQTFNNNWARPTVQLSAPAGGATVTGTVSMGKLICLLGMATDNPARLRLYSTTAEMEADLARDATTDPPAGTGCTFEGTTTSELTSFNCAPIPFIQNNTQPVSDLIAYSLEPQSDLEVTCTLTYQVFQS